MEDSVSILHHAKRILKKWVYFFNYPNWFGKWILKYVVSNRFIDPYGEITKQVDLVKCIIAL